MRWQIELLFKLWKSEAALDRIAGQQTARMECEWYAKLIGLLLFACLVSPLRWSNGRELSLTKAWNIFQRRMPAWLTAFRQPSDLAPLLLDLYQRWTKRAYKEKRKTAPYTISVNLSSFQTFQHNS